MASDTFNNYVFCPFDKAHRVLRGRLSIHLDRCSRNLDNPKQFLICPFNENHRYKGKQLREHIRDCPDRGFAETFVQTTEQFPVSAPTHQVLVVCEENWDDEPDVPTYNPNVYCESNLIIRSNGLKGKSKAERRNFRENERRRFAENC